MPDDMNVWKYTYIQFFKKRRRVIGKDGADDYAAMLFVALLDCLFYWGVITFADSFTGYHLLPGHEILHTVLFLGGAVIIERVHNRTLCKGGAFERIRKEVEAEPRKMLWGILSLLYIMSAVAFFALSLYCNVNKLVLVLIPL
ncbi:hypothetical protein B5F34_03325 [Mediterranea sp. An20]|uniref:hypothetical protein n=2 Tax=Bacteroidaceae TaxID=815 RepID=UPI000B3AA53A|nr:hypothetical protein [Mediterranea sp. An20]OUP11542.1 hypothetical protein B5F34_03325 [Mediterranea sp. An20]